MFETKEEPIQDKHLVYPRQYPTRACWLRVVQLVRSLADNVPNWVRLVTGEPLRKLHPVKG